MIPLMVEESREHRLAMFNIRKVEAVTLLSSNRKRASNITSMLVWVGEYAFMPIKIFTEVIREWPMELMIWIISCSISICP